MLLSTFLLSGCYTLLTNDENLELQYHSDSNEEPEESTVEESAYETWPVPQPEPTKYYPPNPPPVVIIINPPSAEPVKKIRGEYKTERPDQGYTTRDRNSGERNVKKRGRK